MQTAFKEIFMDVRGTFSSKRTVIFLCVIMMLCAFFGQVFFAFAVPQWMFEAIVYVIIAGLGMVGAEHLGTFKSQ